jgi:hypothetical protein
LFVGGKIVDTTTVVYDCKTLAGGCGNEPSASKNTEVVIAAIIVLLFIIVATFTKRRFTKSSMKKSNGTIATAVALFIAANTLLSLPHAFADSTSVQSGPYSGFVKESDNGPHGGTGYQKIVQMFVTTVYNANASVANGSTVSNGQSITFSTPYSNPDISWYGAGAWTDSPYGYWGTGGGGCNPSNSNGNLYVDVVLNRPPISVSGNGMNCVGMTCTVAAGSGSVSATVNFGNAGGVGTVTNDDFTGGDQTCIGGSVINIGQPTASITFNYTVGGGTPSVYLQIGEIMDFLHDKIAILHQTINDIAQSIFSTTFAGQR